MTHRIRPKCRKVQKLVVTRRIACVRSRGSKVDKKVLEAGLVMHARIEAVVDPVSLTELANLFECNKCGNPTGTILYGVPYAHFTFPDEV